MTTGQKAILVIFGLPIAYAIFRLGNKIGTTFGEGVVYLGVILFFGLGFVSLFCYTAILLYVAARQQDRIDAQSKPPTITVSQTNNHLSMDQTPAGKQKQLRG